MLYDVTNTVGIPNGIPNGIQGLRGRTVKSDTRVGETAPGGGKVAHAYVRAYFDNDDPDKGWVPAIWDTASEDNWLEIGANKVGACAGTKLVSYLRHTLGVNTECLVEAWYANTNNINSVAEDFRPQNSVNIPLFAQPAVRNYVGQFYRDGQVVPSCTTCQTIIPPLL